jgi:hypothetical protein
MDQTTKAIIVDIDGCIADLSHRLHFIKPPEGQKKDWPAFYAAMKDDEVNWWCRTILASMIKNEVVCIFVTGRPEEYRETTEDWLRNKAHIKNFVLFMRQNNDYSHADDFKKRVYEDSIKNEFDVLFAIDDDPKIVDMWFSVGLPSLYVKNTDYQ